MSLPNPPQQYSQQDQSQTRAEIERRDRENYKRTQDVEFTSAQRVIMTDTDTGQRGVLSVASGVVTWTAL
jgi:predicted phosphoribosyltransferase